ncbi:MAG: hypothetical protein QOD84_1135, partial [Acidobacteriaceae bacterium]
MKFQTIVIGYVLALALFLFAQHRRADIAPTPSVFHGIVDLSHPSMGPTAQTASSKDAAFSSKAKGTIRNQDNATQIEAPARVS